MGRFEHRDRSHPVDLETAERILVAVDGGRTGCLGRDQADGVGALFPQDGGQCVDIQQVDLTKRDLALQRGAQGEVIADVRGNDVVTIGLEALHHPDADGSQCADEYDAHVGSH